MQEDLKREVKRLKQELATANREQAATHDYLQTVLQEQEHINQNFRVANEEILSSNEELQSTNEELVTAKEEIQATNEELNTTNDELRSRNIESQQLNNDLTNLLTSINIPILMLTNDLRIRRFTPVAQKLFNFIPTDAGRPFNDIRTNFNIPNLESLFLEVIETLSIKELEIQTKEGYWYNLRIRPYRTEDNKIDGVVLMLLDIDALKRSAATLEAARNYAEAIVETVQVPLLVLNSDFRINKANRSFYETFQVSSSDTTQSSIFELGNGQWNLPKLRALLLDILVNDTSIQNLEIEHRFEQIGQKTMLLNGWKVIQDEDAQMILLAIEDITEQKQFEAERSQLLLQEHSARQQAERANQAKDKFLSNLSHELRNPLNTIMGWAQLLRTRQLDEATVTRGLELLERSTKVQARLIEDLLDVSRITSGKLHLDTRLIDLVSVVDAAIESVRLSAEAKNIQIVSQLNSATIVGDAERLQQVLWNLLSNAIKFTPSGGQIEITLETVQTYAAIQVSDTGQGIPADLLPHIFEPFRQGDSSSRKASPGLGLGLSIVRQIVELHSGTVEASSLGEGKGATFKVQLPLLKNTDKEIENLTSSPAHLINPSRLDGLRVLVVDDEAGLLELIKTILEQYGAEVTAVTSAKEALAVLTENPGRHDVLLSDIGMPGEDGYALLRQVRALSAELGGQIPAAALTAYVRVEEQSASLDAGFQGHIAKPVEPAQLVAIVADLAGLN